MRFISFQAPAKRLNMNDRMHWAKRYQLSEAWKKAAVVAGKNARHGWRIKGMPWEPEPSIVTVSFNVASHRRRDPHNAAPTVKAIIDGLVVAGFWPDDNADWVAVTDPVFNVVGSKRPDKDQVTVALHPWRNPQ